MSTLGTFANFTAKKGSAGKKTAEQLPLKPASMVQYPEGATNVPNKQYRLGETNVPGKQAANLPYKSNRRRVGGEKVKKGFDKLEKLKGIKNRNLLIGAGLGLAGLGTAGAIAYNNRDSARRSDMSFGSAFANFALSAEERKAAKDRLDKAGINVTNSTPDQVAATRKRRSETVKSLTKTGNADADSAIKLVRDETRKNRRKELGKVKTQRGFESAADRGDAYKNAKGGEYISRTLATAGSPERALIAQGKRSQNGFVKGLAETSENIGKAGYKEGATGLRKAGNAIAGRTMIGKGVRLGAAGIGLSAIGGAMKRNRQERG